MSIEISPKLSHRVSTCRGVDALACVQTQRRGFNIMQQGKMPESVRRFPKREFAFVSGFVFASMRARRHPQSTSRETAKRLPAFQPPKTFGDILQTEKCFSFSQAACSNHHATRRRNNSRRATILSLAILLIDFYHKHIANDKR